LENSAGFADKEKGEAYVRANAVKGIEDATIQHEIQELLATTSTHEKDGIRFGWFRNLFGFSSQPAVNVVAPTLAAILAAPLGPVASAAAAAGTSAITQKLNTGSVSPLQVGLAGVGGGLAGGGMGAGVQTAKGAGSSYLGQVGSGLLGYTPTATTAGTSGLLGSGGHVLGIGAGSLAPTGAASSLTASPAAQTAAQGLVSGATNIGMKTAGTVASTAAPSVLGAIAPAVAAGLQGPVTSAQSAQGLTNLSQVPSATPATTNLLGNTPATTLNAPVAPAQATPALSSTPQVAQAPVVPTEGVGGGSNIQTPNVAKASWLDKTKDKLWNIGTDPSTILGAGSLMASMGQQAPAFEQPQSVDYLRQQLMQQLEGGQYGGLTEVGKQAQVELGNILSSTPQELYPTESDAYYNAALRRTRETYANAEKQLDAQYNLTGMYGSGEHLEAKRKLQEELSQTESGLYAQTEARNFELARTEKYNAIQTALGVDKNVMDDLVGLTGYDVQTAAAIYGAKAADVTAMREALGTLGVELLLRGTTGQGTKSTGGININLGGQAQ